MQPSFAEIEAESGMQISNLGIRVPAPMSEDVNGGESPHDRAWTVRTDRIRVPAPMSEDVNGGESPHDRAWTNRMATIRVPAPRLELGTP